MVEIDEGAKRVEEYFSCRERHYVLVSHYQLTHRSMWVFVHGGDWWDKAEGQCFGVWYYCGLVDGGPYKLKVERVLRNGPMGDEADDGYEQWGYLISGNDTELIIKADGIDLKYPVDGPLSPPKKG